MKIEASSDFLKQMSSSLRDIYRSAFAEALSNEWRNVIYSYLDRGRRDNIREPLFVFIDGNRFLGRWVPAPIPTIELSEVLLWKHPWYTVMDVFRHEVAHQLRDFLYPDTDESPHGTLFRKICADIGASAEAASELEALDARLALQDNGTSVGGTLLSRIRKLLNMAEHGDHNEARVALAKAMEIMAKNGLSQEDVQESDTYVCIAVGDIMKRRSPEEGMLSYMLKQFWSVRCIWDRVPIRGSFAKVGRGFEHGSQLNLCGTRRNVSIAVYVYNYVHQQIEREWRIFCANTGNRISAVRKRSNFAFGIIKGMLASLENKASDSEIFALIHKGDPALEAFFNARFPITKNTGFGISRPDIAIFNAGIRIGRNIKISPGIANGNSPKKLNQ